EAVLRENGFSPDDAPDPEELEQWMATRLALSNPDLMPSLMSLITGQTTPTPTRESNTGPNTPPQEPPPLAASAPPPGHTSWLRAVQQVALRALDRAGKRMLSRPQRRWSSPATHVHPWDVHTVTDQFQSP